MSDSIRLSRQELYDRVWSMPLSKLGPDLGMSGRGLAKLCLRERIPVPNRGYWAKKAFGHNPTRRRLPERTAGQSDQLSFGVPRPEAPVDSAPRPQPPSIPIAASLERAHPIVRRAISAFRHAKPADDGRLVPRKWDVLHPNVGSETLDRAFRLCDALFRYLETRGAKIRISDQRGHRTEIVVDDVVLEFRIDEKTSRSDRPLTAEERAKIKRGEPLHLWNRYIYAPAGKLRLHLRDVEFNRDCGTWSDGKSGVETRLGEVALGVQAAVEAVLQARIARAEAEVRRREAEERARIVARKQEVERTRREAFDKLIAHWTHGRAVRDLVDVLREQAAERGNLLSSETRFGRWLAWAERYAADLDPRNWDFEALPAAFRHSWGSPDDYREDA